MSFSLPDEITPVQISLQVTFPKFLIIPIPLLWTLLKAAVPFLKGDSLMGSLPVYSWAAWSLPYLTRKFCLLSSQWLSPLAPRYGSDFLSHSSGGTAGRERFSLIQNQTSVLCCLLLPSGTCKVLQGLPKKERRSWMLSFGGEWKPNFFCVHETHLTPSNSSLSLSVFLPKWKSSKKMQSSQSLVLYFFWGFFWFCFFSHVIICITNLREYNVKAPFLTKKAQKTQNLTF